MDYLINHLLKVAVEFRLKAFLLFRFSYSILRNIHLFLIFGECKFQGGKVKKRIIGFTYEE
jgi:hypothetical protein